MAQVIVTESSLENIAGAIRAKLGTQDTYKPSEMAGAIAQIHGDPVLEALDVRANGTYTPSSGKDGFSQAVVNVPNSYSSGDEGKVVSGGALVAQSSQSITQNGTYNTTLKNQAIVNVANSYSSSDEGKVVSNGTLVGQSSQGINANGTYNTTLKNEVVVNVPNSYSASDEGKVVDNGALVAQSSQTITENGTYNTTLKNQVIVNVSGGGGGIPFFDMGAYFGNDEGTAITSLAINTEGHIGDKAILIVMHRVAITLDSSWTLIHKYENPTDSTHTTTQYISVYEKIITSSEESYSIQQDTSARLCACLFYISSGATLQYDSAISMDSTKSIYTFYIPVKNKYTLCIMDCTTAGNGITSISPQIAVNVKTALTTTTTRRMLAFINTSISTVELQTTTGISESALFNNRMILYKISM